MLKPNTGRALGSSATTLLCDSLCILYLSPIKDSMEAEGEGFSVSVFAFNTRDLGPDTSDQGYT